jgi:hypothetical protein
MKVCSAAHLRAAWLGFLILSLGFLLPGCGKNVAKVTGTIKYDGKDLPVGTVAIYGEGDKFASGGIEDGKYTVMNAPVGDVKIAVTVPTDASASGTEGSRSPGQMKDASQVKDMQGKTAMKKPLPIPPIYSDKEKSGITTTLKKGNNTFDIDMPKKDMPKK